jgi:hypothetical protein
MDKFETEVKIVEILKTVYDLKFRLTYMTWD